MIKISALNKTYNEGRLNEVRSIQNLNLSIAANDFVVIVGANGSGKSTLLNCIAGSVLPSSGSIIIDGTDVSRLPDYKRSRWIARVFQNPLSGTAPDLSILENFRLAALRTRSKSLTIGTTEAFKNQVEEKVALLGMGLEAKLEQPIGTLSGGQRQALTLLMAVMDELKILLLDEPTAALDPRSADLVMKTADKIIKEYGLTAVMVTHNIKDAYTYGNRVVQMSEGSVLRDIEQEEKKGLDVATIYEWFG
ncbi:ABC transporter ATP-binding protein [Desertivirga arenae]|uniref:ABC transporter ATP-binding protein n=1 Tax=Desertivirga arenae TaxID=2810309 RepID=UPI001A973865|nr:ATP-binding cassette domain-containing protein [Pedobacter sp. SYSU D00823]